MRYPCKDCGRKFTSRNWFNAHLTDGRCQVAPIYGPLAMATDPLVTSITKVRREWRKTPPGMLQTLLDEQSRWKRKLTIAQNKLAAVRDDIDKFAAELAKERTDK